MTPTDPRFAQVSFSLRRLGEIWSCPDLVDRTSVRFSSRLTRAVGRADPDRALITLAASLPADGELLDEVLCHELAHLVAHARVGRSEPPHGPTWQALVREGGHSPALRTSGLSAKARGQLAAAFTALPSTAQAKEPRRFHHTCPVCSYSRIARRRMSRWRCADCVSAGLDGVLDIQSVPAQA